MNTVIGTDWITVPQSYINKPERVYREGAGFHFMLAPSDIPVAFRAILAPDESHKEMLVEFKYLTAPESTKIIDREGGIKAEIGKNSMRLYRLIVDLTDYSEKDSMSFESQVNCAIPEMSKAVIEFLNDGKLSSGNADAVRRLFDMKDVFHHSFTG